VVKIRVEVPQDGYRKVLRNVGILQQHYAASQLLESLLCYLRIFVILFVTLAECQRLRLGLKIKGPMFDLVCGLLEVDCSPSVGISSKVPKILKQR